MTALARSAGAPIELLGQVSIGHEWTPVTRLVLDRELPGVGDTVIVKTRRVDGEGHGGPAFLRRESAGLQTAQSSGVTPCLIHFDDDAGLVIQTDVGDWPTLQGLLMGGDPSKATTGMIDMGTSVGRLHAATIGKEDGHRHILDGNAADVDTGLNYVYGADRWDGIEQACADLGLPSASPARPDVLRLLQRIFEPGPYTALTHLDLNPTNVLSTDHGARLVDFEGCRFGQLGIDASFLHYPFPHHSTPWATVPTSVIDAADLAYRTALASGGAHHALARYDHMLADGAAAVLIARISRLPLLARPDQSPHNSWRRRGQILQQIQVFTRLAEKADPLWALADWLRSLATAMIDRWPDASNAQAPLFPAFAQTPQLPPILSGPDSQTTAPPALNQMSQ